MKEEKKQLSITKNKKAFFDYEILESWEAWIELMWHEVKSLREWKVQLKWAYVWLQQWQLYLKWCLITPLSSLAKAMVDGKRERKLFLHKKVIEFVSSKIKEPGKTIVPTEIYFSGSLVKVRVALASGKKMYDKKQSLKEKAMDKQAKIQMKNITY